MWDTAYSRASRLLVAGWAIFAAINLGAMFALPGAETIPFHFVWISFALVYGLRRPWGTRQTYLTLALIVGLSSWALLESLRKGFIGIEELSEVPLMTGLFLVMVWHVHRRQASLGQIERLVALESRRAEALQLFVRLGSHELRTPITVARGYTELIRAAHPDPETDEDAGIVLDELSKLERITTRLLTLLLVDSALPNAVVNLDETIEHIMRRWAPTAPRRWEVDSRAGLATINVDRFETALDSLLENAVKFTSDSDVIRVEARREATDIVIEVRDTGRGIPADELPFIFDHFATGASAGARAGTGLGLPIVRAAMAARGGTVEVRSQLGEGTTFLLRIPEQVPDLPGVALQFNPLPSFVPQRRRAGDRSLNPA
jgi:two-component system, OmpR family, sensor kinase